MSVYVILGTPGAFDFDAFSDSTRKALALLAPLTGANMGDYEVAREISVQAREYIRAIQLGLSAAQHGFTATEDILAFADLMHDTTLQERNEYLIGTLELAEKAYAEARESYQVFRNARITLYRLTDNFNQMLQNPPSKQRLFSRGETQSAKRSVEELRRGMDILEAFSNQASALAQWWDWVKVETNPNRHAQPTVAFDYESLSHAAVITRWKLLRSQFAAYSNMAHGLEDTYPHLLLSSNGSASDIQLLRAAGQAQGGYSRQDLRQALHAFKRNAAKNQYQAHCCTIM